MKIIMMVMATQFMQNILINIIRICAIVLNIALN